MDATFNRVQSVLVKMFRKIESKFRRCTSSSRSDENMDKLKQENACLRKTLDEVFRQQGAPSDSQSNQVLLERILALETIREKNSQQILERDQEIIHLWHLLRSDRDEVVLGLYGELKQMKADAAKREKLFQSLTQETEEMKKRLEASAKCQILENTSPAGTADAHVATRDFTLIEEQLKDALKKNQQWLVYDQQREAYVKALLAEKCRLEQELQQAKNAIQQRETDSGM
ncbi:centrosomal protein of 55 kDa-like isoform X1 [Clarias gariepinus]|uniref:centrosomal protein of 55 kDa-like isoform X1 n=1 Tax=Clarias gariepinus TaxID=13013 RepID=UPI00234DFC52|nr:centrosomal protein of 55 kDa-like isoform X1 [Clarias gariepinus]